MTATENDQFSVVGSGDDGVGRGCAVSSRAYRTLKRAKPLDRGGTSYIGRLSASKYGSDECCT